MLAPLTQSEPVRWRIIDKEAREFRLRQISNRRKMNAMARSRGFRNYDEMSEYVA